MIAIVSSNPRERLAFAALCASRGWACTECGTIATLEALLSRLSPKIVLLRHRLADGYADDAIALLTRRGLLPMTKVVVLIAAGSSGAVEARQITLGADLVQRDPVRTEVLSEYLAKYHAAAQHHAKTPSVEIQPGIVAFAGAQLAIAERQLRNGEAVTMLTPREVVLVGLMVRHREKLLTYEVLYSEILNRPFRADTSNMRVLLARLTTSTRRVRVDLRRWIEVVPKEGYRYRAKEKEPVPRLKNQRALPFAP